MRWLLPTVALLGVLGTPAEMAKACPVCSLLGNCSKTACPSAQDSCLFSQLYLDGTLMENGSCVAPGECREAVYALTYGPNSSLWVHTACCENNCSRPARPGAVSPARPNEVKCPYCSGDKSALCDSLSVINCTGNQTVCVTLNGTWSGGDPQILKGCATPEVCHLSKNTTLGPEESGFRLTADPECNHPTLPKEPGPHTTTTHAKANGTICFTCSDLNHCYPLPCPADENYCLQKAGVLKLWESNQVTWRNGSCVASKDCKFHNSISALTNSANVSFWVNTSCCQGNCQEPTPLAPLPTSRTLSDFLCPSCSGGFPGPCNASFYEQCPRGQTECVQLNLVPEAGNGACVCVRECVCVPVHE
ncbi:uncharacterized protein [Dasypus novemcinctus]|uniref:uncharacterized protein isoform X2 n=1 Tax=Dasypus novemcinctus TaxID=9361 RepID=UPI00265FB419|nr:uncharacterized protein LOC101434721 [Dasypus novemcinctus]